jgi:hypothetical protein
MTATFNAFARAIFSTLFPALSRSATANGTAIDMVDYEGVAVVYLDSAAAGAGTLDLALQDSPDNSTFTAIPLGNIVGGAFTQVTTGGASLQTRFIDMNNTQRYVRAVCTIATGPVVFSVEIVGQKKYQS